MNGLRRPSLWLLFGWLGLLWLSGCSGEDAPVGMATPPAMLYEQVSRDALQPVMGQTVYVPAYSEIFFGDRERTTSLAITLAIHNTSSDAPIVLTAVRYHNNEGALVTEHVPEPLRLPPLATASYVVDRQDRTGGVGANFIVEWVAETEVSPPVVEAIMVAPEDRQGISFISLGRVIEEFPTEPE